MSTQLDRLEQKFDAHIKQSVDMGKKLDDICFTIMGNEKAKIKGMASKVDDHEQYISADKKLRWLTYGSSGANVGFLAWLKYHLGI